MVVRRPKKHEKRKSTAIEVFGDAKFVLHKWNSNVAELEETHEPENVDSELSFAKQQLGAQTSESKVLGLLWNKQLDILTVTFPQDETPASKRELLKKLAKVYDPLGLTTPTIHVTREVDLPRNLQPETTMGPTTY